MALDPALPASMVATLDDFRRRLSNLERSPRLTSASIRGGLLRVLDTAGRALLELGQKEGETVFRLRRPDGSTAMLLGKAEGDTTYLSVVDRNGRVVISDDAISGGLATPWVPVSVAPLANMDGGYVQVEPADTGPRDVYVSRFRHQHPKLLVDGVLAAPSGTSARLFITNETGTEVLSVTASAQTLSFAEVIGPAQLDQSKVGTWRQLNVKVERTSGTGRVGVRINAMVGRQT